MKKLSNIFLLLLLLGYASTALAGGVPGGDEKQKGMAKTTTNDAYDFIGINNILMYIGNNGSTAHNNTTDASGLEWPRGSGKYCIFTDGLIWGGTVQGEVRVGGATYRYGLQAGPIKADGTPADPSDPRYRIYKVRKVTAESIGQLTQAEQDRLKKDFNEWPVGDGAPWTGNEDAIKRSDMTTDVLTAHIARTCIRAQAASLNGDHPVDAVGTPCLDQRFQRRIRLNRIDRHIGQSAACQRRFASCTADLIREQTTAYADPGQSQCQQRRTGRAIGLRRRRRSTRHEETGQYADIRWLRGGERRNRAP